MSCKIQSTGDTGLGVQYYIGYHYSKVGVVTGTPNLVFWGVLRQNETATLVSWDTDSAEPPRIHLLHSQLWILSQLQSYSQYYSTAMLYG